MLSRALLVVLLGGCALAASAGDADKMKLTPEEQRVLDSTNEVRKKEGLQPLRINPLLVEAARKHSQMMAMRSQLEHEFDGIGLDKRLKKVGYKFNAYGENILYTVKSGVEAANIAMEKWLDSKTHRGNILAKDYTEVGIGMAINEKGVIYFTQDFGTPQK
jgi:uncharacterized protein YkwD